MYREYYKMYLGVKTFENQVVSSVQRNVPLNKQYYYSVVVSEIEDALIYSVKPEWLELFQRESLESASPEDVLKSLNEKENLKHEYRTMYRLVYKKKEFLETKAVVVTKELFRKHHIGKTEDFFSANFEKNKELFDAGRRFWSYDEKDWAASGLISDIDFNGGNIAVFTDEQYRKRGHGKEVVKACINWCLHHNVIPVYLVDCHNTSSIALAKTLGFECIAKEWILSQVK